MTTIAYVNVPLSVQAAENDLFAMGPDQIKADLEGYFQKAAAAIAASDLRAAHQELSLINFRIDKYKKALSADDKKAFKSRVASLDASMRQKVDSLVKANIAIVQKQGRRAGYEFRQNLSVQTGLSETELAPVDQAISESNNEGEENAGTPSVTPARETPSVQYASPQIPAAPSETALAPQQQPSPPPLREKTPEPSPAVQTQAPAAPVVRPAAPPVVPRTPDTAQIPTGTAQQPSETAQPEPSAVVPSSPEKQQPDVEAERGRLTATSNSVRIRSLLDEGNTEEAMTVFQIYQTNLGRYLDRATYENLKQAVETSFSQDKSRRAHASQEAQTIGRLLDADRAPDAFGELKKSRDELLRYLDKQEMRELEKRVGQAYVEFNRRQTSAIAAVDDIRRLVSEKRVEEAYSLFEKKTAEIERYCTRDVYDAVRKEVAAAYNATKDKKRFGTSCRRDIVSLIKAGREPEASARFFENRPLLAENLDSASFASLQAAVEKANTIFTARQRDANMLFARVDSLLGAQRAREAHDLFDASKEKIRRSIADDKRFFDLKERVEKAYADFRDQQRQAAQTSEKISRLMDDRQGKKADLLFKEETPFLRKYLDPNEFVRLENAAAAAHGDYDKKAASAAASVSQIAVLLNQNKVEQAYEAYEKADDDIDFYCDDNTAEGLAKRVKAAHAIFKERRTWATGVAKQVKDLANRKKGSEAYALFIQERPELAKYCDAKTIASLDTIVTAANKRYVAAKAHAEQDASVIRGMIVSHRVEDAYAAFDTLEPVLRFYLESSVFSALKTLVEKLNTEIKGNKQEARNIVSSIIRLIEKERGDTAWVLMSNNEGILKAYLPARVYASLKARTARAKTDWDKNCAIAQTLADKLQTRAQREDGAVSAHDEFVDKRGFLEQYLVNWKFSRLSVAVGTPFDAFMEKRKQARAVGNAITRMIRQNQGVEARAEFQNRSAMLAKYMPKDEYSDLSAKVAKAYDATLHGRKEAKLALEKIRRLLDAGTIAEAHRAFTDAKPTLETYLPDAEFDRISTEVTSAYDDLEKKAKQVRDYADKLRDLVAKNKLWDAYKGFRMNHPILAEYLDAQAYADLESTVVGTYEKAKAKARAQRGQR